MNILTEKLTRHCVNLHLIEAGTGQCFITASKVSYSNEVAVTAIYNRIGDVLREKGVIIVHERIFGSQNAESEIMVVRKRALENNGISCDGPVTYIEGASPDGDGFAGVAIRAIVPRKTDDVWTIHDDGMSVGRGWRRNGSTFIILQNIQGIDQYYRHPHLTSPIKREESDRCPPSCQARAMFENADRILRKKDASYRDVVRTWFYLLDILNWYPEFNKSRNCNYREFGIMPDPLQKSLQLPASTGVGARNSHGNAAAMDLLAVTGPAETRPIVRQLTNSRQLDAFQYGSVFSRGAVIQEPDATIIEVSGTSAIDERGESLYPGVAHSQIACTLDKVEALIGQEGAGLRDIATATAFLMQPEAAKLFQEAAAARGLEHMPTICVVADICREELLFEMDAVVVMKKGKES